MHLITFIAVSAERVFNLSRCIDFHKISTASIKKDAIAIVTRVLINLNETEKRKQVLN